jgi:hypothetical protein
MAALTETYIDPAIAADSGTGVIGDPYGDVQYALNTKTRDATNGDRFNIKAGTDEILAATLSFATYGTPTASAPLVFSGYTSAAGDGGQGGISGNGGNFNVFDGSKIAVSFVDLELHNTGSASICKFGTSGCNFFNCEIHNTTSYGLEDNASIGTVVGCYIYDFDADGILLDSGACVGNYIVCDNAANRAINFAPATSPFVTVASRNIISITADSNGIIANSAHNTVIQNNSVFTTFAGTKRGIFINGGHGSGAVMNNVVEGFSGVGGAGIEVPAAAQCGILGYNSVFNCTDAYDLTGDVTINLGNNETLSVTAFLKSGSDTFANRFVYFQPVVSGSVIRGSYPSGSGLDRGAVQFSGGMLRHPGMTGGCSA